MFLVLSVMMESGMGTVSRCLGALEKFSASKIPMNIVCSTYASAVTFIAMLVYIGIEYIHKRIHITTKGVYKVFIHPKDDVQTTYIYIYLLIHTYLFG